MYFINQFIDQKEHILFIDINPGLAPHTISVRCIYNVYHFIIQDILLNKLHYVVTPQRNMQQRVSRIVDQIILMRVWHILLLI